MLLAFFESLNKACFNEIGYNFDDVSKNGYSRLVDVVM